ncbi:L,D-transpeptidase family protein [Streptomyces sp. NBC_01264]|uniref:L,D-transpeptidase family protein n=1 Tax=Streptomyces sp. NBC_01264 TaxID=2903804 RepID=UPI00225A760F|nr:L,D-transpeptidase family protein [Streptomyces sp. NBC_01264]MCX4781169.1 L,D-transpeptidase family protein [Streptomyces sp. NBC_01264]
MRARDTAEAVGAIGRAAATAAILAAAVLVPPQAAAVAAPSPTPSAPAEGACTAGTGPYQRELEGHLRRTADGRQDAGDCEAIRTFQRANGIRPADGYAGLVTYRTMVAVAARANPNAGGGCPVRSHRVTCVDLERQLLWVQRGRTVVLPPVPVRTGRDEEETRRGWHEVYWRSEGHVSTLYDSPMPYAQFFDGGQALHGRPGNLYAHGGSAGCVNLTVPDARRLWDLLTEGDAVYVWGTKPGTED